VLPEVAAVQSLTQRHSLSFVGLGTFGANAQYGAESCVCPFRLLQFLDFLPGALLRLVCYATKLADNRKDLHIKNPQKNPLKIGSSIDIKPRQEQNCCVLLGSQTLGAEFYSALSLSSPPTIQN